MHTLNARHPVDAIRASVKAFLRQTLNSYARLIWVRLPSAIFHQLSIQQAADKSGKTQVKETPDKGVFIPMIGLGAGMPYGAGNDDRSCESEK